MTHGAGRPGQEQDRLARAALTCIAEPGDPQLGALLRTCSPAAIVAALTAGRVPAGAGGTGPAGAGGTGPDGAGGTGPDGADRPGIPGLDRALRRWTARLADVPTEVELDAWQASGIRLLCPGDPGWPGQLDVLGDARPCALWVRGRADLRFACLRSVSIVGTRAATAYGIHVCTELAAALAGRGWAVVSGGAFGIDGHAHRGALAAEGITIAVLPSGVDDPYPRGHHELFQAIASHGALVSEWPPGRTPTRHGFLVRNRVIAALSRGTVVVEAALRSGALNTARHARDQNRPLMAVPGPVTSTASAGCHLAIREWGAECVTGARDVIAHLSFGADDLPGLPHDPVLPRDALNPVSRTVLEAVPARVGFGPARIAVLAGVDFDTVLRCLGELAAGGFIERCGQGWRVRRPG
ncbi:MAG TPA: DNA-processing protein DprA [Streptosporangiaceae bacterium]|nr:DNA-processing protein DprA [Streptosporangiaceae bacterium]